MLNGSIKTNIKLSTFNSHQSRILFLVKEYFAIVINLLINIPMLKCPCRKIVNNLAFLETAKINQDIKHY